MVIDLGVGTTINAGTLICAQQYPYVARLRDDCNGSIACQIEFWTGVRKGLSPPSRWFLAGHNPVSTFNRKSRFKSAISTACSASFFSSAFCFSRTLAQS
jgi:hypothetical protein